MVTTKDNKELVTEALDHPNVQAFLRMIRYAEGTSGTDGYRTMFTGTLFSAPPWYHPNIINEANGLRSTAAGAYQFLKSTWDILSESLGFNGDFKPGNQDLAAIELLRRRKALDYVIDGDIRHAIYGVPIGLDDDENEIFKPNTGANKEWASLPGSPYGQPVKTYAQIRNYYQNAGGALA